MKRCLNCNSEFNPRTSKQKYCSRACYMQHRHKLHKSSKVTIQCQWCKDEFKVFPHSKDRARFCSLKCKLAYQRRNQWIDKCGHCGKPVTVDWNNKDSKIRYCSPECYKAARNTKKEVTCTGCGKKFIAQGSRIRYYNNLYCSRECYQEHGLIGTRGYETNDEYDLIRSRLCSTARYLRWKATVLERDNYSCTKCGSTEQLRVHHINELYRIVYKYNPKLSVGNMIATLESSEFNDITNGITLCNSCHMKIHMHNRPTDEQSSVANPVNSGEALAGEAEGNPEPSPGRGRRRDYG